MYSTVHTLGQTPGLCHRVPRGRGWGLGLDDEMKCTERGPVLAISAAPTGTTQSTVTESQTPPQSRMISEPAAGRRSCQMSHDAFASEAVPESASLSTSSNPRHARRTLAALAAFTALAALSMFAPRAEAQRPFAIRPNVGVFVPTGDQKDLLDNAVLVGLQASYDITPSFALVGSFGWAPTKDLTLANEKVDLFQYDLGIQGRLPNLTPSAGVSTRPYATLGAGGRTYNYRDISDADAQTNFLGYGALGVDFAQATGPLGLRLEARDNVTAFKGLQGELAERKARNDLQFSAGLTLAF